MASCPALTTSGSPHHCSILNKQIVPPSEATYSQGSIPFDDLASALRMTLRVYRIISETGCNVHLTVKLLFPWKDEFDRQ